MSDNMNKQLFNLFLTSLAKKPKLADWEIRETHLRNNLGVKGKRKGEMGKETTNHHYQALPNLLLWQAHQFKKTKNQEDAGRAVLKTSCREPFLPLQEGGRRRKVPEDQNRRCPQHKLCKVCGTQKDLLANLKSYQKRNDESLIIHAKSIAEKYSSDISHAVHLWNKSSN